MALTTYITSAEATYFYDDARYASGEKSQALTISFGLLNGYLNSALEIPIVPEWNGSDTTLPGSDILKTAQGNFYEWLLRKGEVGNTPPVKAVFDAAVEFAQSITQDQLTIPSAGTFEREVGWHLVSKSNTGGGDCFIKGSAPTYNQHIKLVITGAATASYPATFTYTLQEPSRSASNTSTGNVTSFLWTDVATLTDGTRPFQIRWVGKWTNNDYIEVRGVAPDMVDATPPPRNTLQQSSVAY